MERGLLPYPGAQAFLQSTVAGGIERAAGQPQPLAIRPLGVGRPQQQDLRRFVRQRDDRRRQFYPDPNGIALIRCL